MNLVLFTCIIATFFTSVTVEGNSDSGNVSWVAGDDTYPVLAHSAYSNTWPTEYNPITGLYEAFWPGWWSQDFNINLPGCSQSRKDPDCWEEVPGRDLDGYPCKITEIRSQSFSLPQSQNRARRPCSI